MADEQDSGAAMVAAEPDAPSSAAPLAVTATELQTTPVAAAARAIAPVAAPRAASLALAPRTAEEARRWAKNAVDSKVFDKLTQAQAEVALAIADELGIHPMKALRQGYFINGKYVMSADLIVGLCKTRKDVCTYFWCKESTNERATFVTQRAGDPGATELTFTLQDAERAGLLAKNPNYRAYPAPMLQKRASVFLARLVYPDLVGNIYDTDELDARQVARATVEAASAAPASVVQGEFEPEIGETDRALLETLAAFGTDAARAPLVEQTAGFNAARTKLAGMRLEGRRREMFVQAVRAAKERLTEACARAELAQRDDVTQPPAAEDA